MESRNGLGVADGVVGEGVADLFERKFHDLDAFVDFEALLRFGEAGGNEQVNFFGQEADGGKNGANREEFFGRVTDFLLEFGASPHFGRLVAFEFAGGNFEHLASDRDAELSGKHDAIAEPRHDAYATGVFDDFPEGLGAVRQFDRAGAHGDDLAAIAQFAGNPFLQSDASEVWDKCARRVAKRRGRGQTGQRPGRFGTVYYRFQILLTPRGGAPAPLFPAYGQRTIAQASRGSSCDMKTIINVANRLPVTIGETYKKSSGGLVSALEGVSQDRFRLQWLGWPGTAFDDPVVRGEVDRRLRSEFGCVPVFLSKEEADAYYDGFSNASLWPILHYNPFLMEYENSQWEAYWAVNKRFAQNVVEMAGEDDLVWVHDYHLMLAPSMIRMERPNLRVGYFLHTPFPSSEVFRCHPRRSELLDGLLGADLIGFHTFGYLRHFRSAVLRVLGVESEIGTIRHGNHVTSLGVYPIGINAKKFSRELATERFEERCRKLRETYRGRRVVLGVERVDYSKGILHRLDAIDQFLSTCENVDDIVFVFVSVPSRESVPAYKSLVEQIEREVGRINGEYSTIHNSPIHFIHGSVPFPDLCALYAVSDVALVTPLADGMNLVAKEYLACQSDADPGVLVLSEFAGASQELVDALIVNPFDTLQVVDALNEALEMPREERLARLEGMRARVLSFDADFWARSFLDDLEQQVQYAQSPMSVEESADAIIARVEGAERVAFFLDYDGTLREFERVPEAAAPNAEVLRLLEQLERTPVDVYIISGRKAEQLEAWLGGRRFTLIAEHGGAYLKAGSTEWGSINPATDFSWKKRVLEVLRHYEGSTPGSEVEEKHSAVVWHYRQADPEFGELKSRQLMSELYEMLVNAPVEVHHGKKIVEVSSIHVNKGVALEYFVKRGTYDCVLCAGDDQTDEAMFRLDRPELLKVKVGEGDSRAEYRIPDQQGFRNLLLRLLKVFERSGAGGRA